MTTTVPLDHEVNSALDEASKYELLYAAGRICGFEAHAAGWTIHVYVGTYPNGEYVEGIARKGELGIRLSPEQAQFARTHLPARMPLPESSDGSPERT